MALLVPDEGEVEMLKRIMGVSVAENLSLKLYTNAATIAEGNTSAAFTECATSGYAAITLTAGGGWTCSTATGTSSATYAQQTFTFTATTSPSVRGYYIVGATSAKVYWAEELYASGQVFNNTDTLKITPKLELA